MTFIKLYHLLTSSYTLSMIYKLHYIVVKRKKIRLDILFSKYIIIAFKKRSILCRFQIEYIETD